MHYWQIKVFIQNLMDVLEFFEPVFSFLLYLACESLTPPSLTEASRLYVKGVLPFFVLEELSFPANCPQFTGWHLCGLLMSCQWSSAERMVRQKPVFSRIDSPVAQTRSCPCVPTPLLDNTMRGHGQVHPQGDRMALCALGDSVVFPLPGSGAEKMVRLHISRKQEAQRSSQVERLVRKKKNSKNTLSLM